MTGKLREEVLNTVRQMQGGTCGGSYYEMQKHLGILLGMVRHKLVVQAAVISINHPTESVEMVGVRNEVEMSPALNELKLGRRVTVHELIDEHWFIGNWSNDVHLSALADISMSFVNQAGGV